MAKATLKYATGKQYIMKRFLNSSYDHTLNYPNVRVESGEIVRINVGDTVMRLALGKYMLLETSEEEQKRPEKAQKGQEKRTESAQISLEDKVEETKKEAKKVSRTKKLEAAIEYARENFDLPEELSLRFNEVCPRLPDNVLRMKRLREKVGLDKSEVSAKLGRSKTFISLVELGKVKLNENDIRKLCDIYRTTPSKLLGWPE